MKLFQKLRGFGKTLNQEIHTGSCDVIIRKNEVRKCSGCGEVYEYTPENFAWVDGKHTRLRGQCRKCTNYASKMSKRIARARQKDMNDSIIKYSKKGK